MTDAMLWQTDVMSHLPQMLQRGEAIQGQGHCIWGLKTMPNRQIPAPRPRSEPFKKEIKRVVFTGGHIEEFDPSPGGGIKRSFRLAAVHRAGQGNNPVHRACGQI